VVEPDDVRALRTGEAFVIRGGEAVKVRIRAGDAAPGPTDATR